MEEDIRNQIQELKEQIKEIYYIREYDKARELEKMLKEIEQSSYQIGMETPVSKKLDFQKRIYGLKFEIYHYMKQDGNEKKAHFLPEEFARKIKQFIGEMDSKASEDLVAELENIVAEAKQVEVKPILMDKMNSLFAKALLYIFMLQAKNQEEIDLKLVEELSTKESFAEEIQAKLIEIAEQKEDSEAFSIFEVCRQVNSEKLQEKAIWRILTGTQEVCFKNESEQISEEKQELEAPKEEILALQPRKASFLDKIKERFGIPSKTTKYVFAEVNKKTGQHKVEYHSFPPKGKLLKKCQKECIELEINDEEIVEIDCIDQMPHLETLSFGRGVRLITRKEDIGSSQPKFGLKRIIFSDDVEKLKGEGLFSKSQGLEYVGFGKNIKEIGRRCFMDCNNLQKVKLPDSLKILESETFLMCKMLEEVEFGKNLEEIGYGCFCGCYNLKNIELPDLLRKLGTAAFYNIDMKKATSIENSAISIPPAVSVEEAENAFCDGVYLKINGKLHRKTDGRLIEMEELKRQYNLKDNAGNLAIGNTKQEGNKRDDGGDNIAR